MNGSKTAAENDQAASAKDPGRGAQPLGELRIVAVSAISEDTLDDAAREETWAEIGRALQEFEGPSGFTGPCELLVGAGTN